MITKWTFKGISAVTDGWCMFMCDRQLRYAHKWTRLWELCRRTPSHTSPPTEFHDIRLPQESTPPHEPYIHEPLIGHRVSDDPVIQATHGLPVFTWSPLRNEQPDVIQVSVAIFPGTYVYINICLKTRTCLQACTCPCRSCIVLS